MARGSGPPGMEQAAFRRGEPVGQEIEGGFGGGDPVGPLKDAAGERQRGDHQAIPVDQDLVVAQGRDAFVAHREQAGTAVGEESFLGRIAQTGMMGPVQDGRAFPVAVAMHVVGGHESRRVRAQDGGDLVGRPDIVFPLDALAVGIEGAGEGETVRIVEVVNAHVAQDPIDGFGDAHGVEGRFGLLPDGGHQFDELRVVVEHLLEMGNQPGFVRGIARETTAKMVVDAALAQMIQGGGHGGTEVGRSVAAMRAPQEGQQIRLREFRRAARAARHRVHDAKDRLGGFVQALERQAGPSAVVGTRASASCSRAALPATLSGWPR